MAADISHAINSLPEPDWEAQEQSRELTSRVCSRADAQDGRLTLGEYIQAALYEPGLGYYVSGQRKFGESGDFITAPELGSVFAKCCARAFARVLGQLEAPDIVELGAGTGRFAYDVLLELERLDALPRHYLILEVSAGLSGRQRQLLETLPEHLAARVHWLDAPPREPFDGVVFANEVIDAIPTERFTWRGEEPVEMDFVGHDDGQLQLLSVSATSSVDATVRTLEQRHGPWSAPYVSELRPGLDHWLATISSALRHGVAIFIDYGAHAAEFYHAQRTSGTLLCHYRHRAHADLLAWPGLQDITAWVDFSVLSNAAHELGFALDGYTTQTHFLIDCQLDEVVSDAFAHASQRQQLQLASEVRRLTMPGEMGERFKVIAFRRGLEHGVFTPAHVGFEEYLLS